MILQTYTNPLYITSLALTRDIDKDLTLVWANFLEAFALKFNFRSAASTDTGWPHKIRDEKESDLDFIQLGCVTYNLIKFWRQKRTVCFTPGWEVGGTMVVNLD